MQLLLAGVAAGHADADRARGVGRSDVVRSVANYEHPPGVNDRAENLDGAVERALLVLRRPSLHEVLPYSNLIGFDPALAG